MTSSYFTYLLEVTICFSLLYLTFFFFLRKLPFHALNRGVLLAMIPLALCLPQLHHFMPEIVVPADISLPDFEGWVKGDVPLVEEVSPEAVISSGIPWLEAVYVLGFLLVLFRMGRSLVNLYSIKRQARVHPSLGAPYFEADIGAICSFGSWVLMPKGKEYASAILEHERAHIRLRHFVDLLLAECWIALCWFNPLVYRYRKSLQAIHEFQADERVLHSSIKKSDYLALLLTHIEEAQSTRLLNYFNYPILKNRIDMITTTVSNKKQRLRYALLFPVLGFLVFVFTAASYPTVIPTIDGFPAISDSGMPVLFPVKGASEKDITSEYGVTRMHPVLKTKKIHTGIDIKAPEGTPVIATADGTITLAEMKGDWGNLIIMKHSDGYETRYAHLHGFNVAAGDEVAAGQVIGYVGNTGKSMGDHLHYEVWQNGKKKNPLNYFAK
jgi:murein DD-endopeptidase MepM/ murein hydrolase activator NlpD